MDVIRYFSPIIDKRMSKVVRVSTFFVVAGTFTRFEHILSTKFLIFVENRPFGIATKSYGSAEN